MSIRLPRCSSLAIMSDLAVMAVSGLLFLVAYNVVRAIEIINVPDVRACGWLAARVVGLLLVPLWVWYLA
ncbi:hypothetical protein [Sphingobium sp. SYK-6]|uniref:hypothetical protein n=1 Tax=Sphingobium sp. (strain NBRC 103272 / SYK-6) TaxID=627192 RepID=UPI0002D57FD6|nr:hypothetical protein [Sphingobium sp. SYK-6]